MKAGPLAGKIVLVTRASGQEAGLRAPLEALGAIVVSIPLIELVDPADWGPADRAIRSLDRYDAIVFTSVNGVERSSSESRRGWERATTRCCPKA